MKEFTETGDQRMERALIVIDYTCDFVADDGRLTCGKPGQAVEERIAQLIEEFAEDPDAYIVIANDIHEEGDPYHPESRLFPPHNIKGSPGRELYGEVGRSVASLQERLGEALRRRMHFIDKTRYSAFAGTDLELRLRERSIEELHLVGVCTDICVLHTAVDAYNRSFRIVVHADGVQSFNPDGHEWALRHFKNTLGAKVMIGGTEADL